MARKDWNINFKKHPRMHQITLFRDKKSKNFLGRGQSPLPDPTHSGEGTQLSRSD